MSGNWRPSETTLAWISSNVIFRRIPSRRGFRRGSVSAAPVAQVDGNRPRDILHHQVGEMKVPHLGFRPELHLDRASVGFIDDAIGNRDVLGVSAAETEDRPARAERAVGHGHEPATAEQRAGVVLRLHVAVADVDAVADAYVKHRYYDTQTDHGRKKH